MAMCSIFIFAIMLTTLSLLRWEGTGKTTRCLATTTWRPSRWLSRVRTNSPICSPGKWNLSLLVLGVHKWTTTTQLSSSLQVLVTWSRRAGDLLHPGLGADSAPQPRLQQPLPQGGKDARPQAFLLTQVPETH